MPTTCKKCGACCIAPSITTAIPNMPQGKPAGTRCANLTANNLCRLFGEPVRPTFCRAWPPSAELCGGSFAEAMGYITALETQTATRPAIGQTKSDHVNDLRSVLETSTAVPRDASTS